MNHTLTIHFIRVIVVLGTCAALILLRFMELSQEKSAFAQACEEQAINPSANPPTHFDKTSTWREKLLVPHTLFGIDSGLRHRTACPQGDSWLHSAQRIMPKLNRQKPAPRSPTSQAYAFESLHSH